MKSLQIIIFFHARKNDSKFVFSNNLKISFFLLIHPQKWGGKINYDLWTIKNDFQIYGQKLFYSNDSVWCSLIPPCVDGVTAAAAADFLGLANRLPAAGQYSRPSEKQHHETADQIKISPCLSRSRCLQTPPDSETQFFLFLFPFLLPPQAVKPSRVKWDLGDKEYWMLWSSKWCAWAVAGGAGSSGAGGGRTPRTPPLRSGPCLGWRRLPPPPSLTKILYRW